MMGPYGAAKNLVQNGSTLTPVTGAQNPTKSASPLLISLLLSASVRVHAQQTPDPADTGKARPNVHRCGVGHRRLRKVCRELGRGCAIVQGGRPQRPVAKQVGSNLWTPGQDTVAQVQTAAYTKTLPGAPAGEYVVIQYDNNFEHQQAAMETLVPSLDGMGSGESPATSFSRGSPELAMTRFLLHRFRTAQSGDLRHGL
jgi:hypothetical protein